MYWKMVQRCEITSVQNWLAENRRRITTEPPETNIEPIAVMPPTL
jgi:hypothetical protein